MNKQLISKINGEDIVTVEQDGEIYVPIKPICEAIGIDFATQYRKLKSEEILSASVVIMTMVAIDDNSRDMVVLPLKFIYGWLFTINPGKVAPEAREAVSRYRRECYDVLYEHFTGSMRRTIETNNAEIELLQQINSAISREKEAKAERRKAEDALGRLRADRLSKQPRLFS